jgi:hypothetical protein
VRDSEKSVWSKPEIDRFHDPDDVWDHFKLKGTPEQRARLRAMLDFARERQGEPKRRSA